MVSVDWEENFKEKLSSGKLDDWMDASTGHNNTQLKANIKREESQTIPSNYSRRGRLGPN